MSDAQPTAPTSGHKLKITLSGNEVKISFTSPLVDRLSNALDHTSKVASDHSHTPCGFAFPNNDLAESGAPNTHEQSTNVLDDSTLFGRFDEDNTVPPAEHKTNMLDVLGGWAATFFTGNPEFAGLASKANRRLFSDVLAGRYDIAGVAREGLKLLSGQTEDNTDVTHEPHINMWDGVITTASADPDRDRTHLEDIQSGKAGNSGADESTDGTPGNGITLDQSQNKSNGQDDSSLAGGTANDDLISSFGGGTGSAFEENVTETQAGTSATCASATNSGVPTARPVPPVSGIRSGTKHHPISEMGQRVTDYPVTPMPVTVHSFGENRIRAELLVDSSHELKQLSPHLEASLREIAGNLYSVNVPSITRLPGRGDTINGYNQRPIRVVSVFTRRVGDKHIGVTLLITGSLFGNHNVECYVHNAFAPIREQIDTALENINFAS